MKNLLWGASLLLILSGIVPGKEWRGIVPLHSTRDDVIRLFGVSSDGGAYAYTFENEQVFFHYQTQDSECGKIWGRWNVPLDTVLGLTIYPKIKALFTDLKLDMSKFKKNKIHLPGMYRYVNEEEGISYAVDDGVAAQIDYFPAAADKRLACPKEEKQP